MSNNIRTGTWAHQPGKDRSDSDEPTFSTYTKRTKRTRTDSPFRKAAQDDNKGKDYLSGYEDADEGRTEAVSSKQ
jgi:hypothetical protein